MESIVEVRRLSEVDDAEWAPFIRCLAWHLEKGPRAGEPPEDWAGPDLAATMVPFTVPGEIEDAKREVLNVASTCVRNPPGIADIGP